MATNPPNKTLRPSQDNYKAIMAVVNDSKNQLLTPAYVANEAIRIGLKQVRKQFVKPNSKNKVMNKTHYRQGDVLIERVETIPPLAQKQKPSKKVILAHGEVTGHHHQLEARRPEKYGKWYDPADWWKVGEIAPTNDKPSIIGGEIFFKLSRGAIITHDEHSNIELSAGTYRVTRQREYSPEAIRNVQD